MNELARINSRGLARGWHAETLREAARRTGETMAACFARMLRESPLSVGASAGAFNVPAEAIEVSPAGADCIRVTYQFTDGSRAEYRAPKRGKR